VPGTTKEGFGWWKKATLNQGEEGERQRLIRLGNHDYLHSSPLLYTRDLAATGVWAKAMTVIGGWGKTA